MHTYRGPHGLIINHNGDCSSMAILRYQGTEIEVPAAEIAPYVEQERIVREIADKDPILHVQAAYDSSDDMGACFYCGVQQIPPYDVPQHQRWCEWLRARAIVARLDAPPDRSG